MLQALLWGCIFFAEAPAIWSYKVAELPHPSEYYCAISPSHVACKFKGKNGISKNCKRYKFNSREFVRLVLGDDVMNKFRNMYAHEGIMGTPSGKYPIPNMNMLVMDDELTKLAELYLFQCPNRNWNSNDVARFSVVQWFHEVATDEALPSAVELFSELITMLISNYHHSGWGGAFQELTPDGKVVSHHDSSIFVNLLSNPYLNNYGCAITEVRKKGKDKAGKILLLNGLDIVCNFGPIKLSYQREQPTGQPCSLCPNGTRCNPDDEFPYLCQEYNETATEATTSATPTVLPVSKGEDKEPITTDKHHERPERIVDLSSCSSICDNGVPHIRCVYNQSSWEYEQVVPIDGREVRESILVWHNEVRSLVAAGIQGYPMAGDMREMQWNTQLASSAQLWASQCKPFKYGCQSEYLTEGADLPTRVTQLVVPYIWNHTQELPPYTKPLNLWIQGVKHFNNDLLQTFILPASKDEDYSSFAQVIWADTYMLGCGVALCLDKVEDPEQNETDEEYTDNLDAGESLLVTVCNYAPGGLLEGKPVFRMGGPCSLCTRLHSNGTGGRYCSREYISLCSDASLVLPFGATLVTWMGIRLIIVFLQ